jgi:hypothetical protein
MKPTSTPTAVGAVIAALSLTVMLAFVAQTAAGPGPNGGPKATNWYSLQRLQAGVKAPPLPSNPFPELPVYALDEGSYAYDDREVDYEKLRSQAPGVSAAAIQSFNRGAALTALEECASELLISPGSNTVTLTITNAPEGKLFDLFRAFTLLGDSITNSAWLWVTNGTNGQSFTFPTAPCDRVFYVLGCTNDSNSDGISDAFQALVSKDWLTNLIIAQDCQVTTLTLTNVTPGQAHDIFRTFEPAGGSLTDSSWFWLARGTNGQSLPFSNCPCSPVRYFVAGTNDADGDLLTDAYEELVNKTSPTNTHSVNALFTDLEMVNVLVNNPEQDCGKEQNTQNETAVIAFSNTVLAAWVDTNKGVPGHGKPDDTCAPDLPIWYTTKVPDNVGWAVSQDGGRSFTDKAGLPLLSNVTYLVLTNPNFGQGFFVTNGTFGTASDPSFARDTNSGITYLIANPRRPSIVYPADEPSHHFLPLWRSTNDGASFEGPINVARGITNRYSTEYADGPSIAVDNFPGPGQGTVYATFGGDGVSPAFCRSDPGGTNWTNTAALRGVPVVAPNHDLYLFVKPWQQPFVIYISTDRGTNFTAPIQTDIDFSDFSFPLLRWIGAASNDHFLAYAGAGIFAVNPVTAHLYFVFVDKPTNGTDHPNIYFRQSIDGGTNWQGAIQVNVEPGGVPTDQWQPVLTVKPDGTQVFIAWYDRREDPTNHSLIRTYGVFADLPVSGPESFTNQFPISTVAFPPAFAGTNTTVGAYDPANPPFLPLDFGCVPGWFGGVYARFMGDYDRAFSDASYVYYTWGDNRLRSTGAVGTARNQPDVRYVRLSWP